MKRRILFIILTLAKFTGAFFIARRLTASDLRILCYHGIALQDEQRFRPGLFMTPQTFRDRMAFLARKQYPVVALEEGLAALADGGGLACPTVITIDDGWYGTYSVMAPAVRQCGFPATVYIASYYFEKQVPVFNVAAAYLLWRGRTQTLDLAQVSDEFSGAFDLSKPDQRDDAVRAILASANALATAEERQSMLRTLCEALGEDWHKFKSGRVCAFMDAGEARELLDMGVDIQLHTHRHRSRPQTFAQAQREITDNRRALAEVTTRPLRHFCYPSGQYDRQEAQWLARLDVVSAVTVTGGFNRPGAPAFELRRFLDSESISPLEFEAEMCGFFELLRRCGISI